MNSFQDVLRRVKYIAFDADDTLWVNEPYFREAEEKFCALLERFAPREEIISTLYNIEIKNLPLYGYGARAFTQSLMETALQLGKSSNESPLTTEEMKQIFAIGISLLSIPIDILPGVEQLLKELHGGGRYTLVVATKGDLLEQHRKLERSSLAGYFHRFEVMIYKNSANYRSMLERMGCSPEEFLMIGNSMKSDIIPVLEIGAYALYVPFYSTWEHEKVEGEVVHPNLFTCDGGSSQLPEFFRI